MPPSTKCLKGAALQAEAPGYKQRPPPRRTDRTKRASKPFACQRCPHGVTANRGKICADCLGRWAPAMVSG